MNSLIIRSGCFFKGQAVKIITGLLAAGLVLSVGFQVNDFFKLQQIIKKANEEKNAFENKKEPLLKVADFTPLFGVETKRKKVLIPKSTLNLKLIGVYASADQRESGAVIQSSMTPKKVYKTGDILPGGALLYEVHTDYVLVKQHEVLERITFSDKKGKAVFQVYDTELTTEKELPIEKIANKKGEKIKHNHGDVY